MGFEPGISVAENDNEKCLWFVFKKDELICSGTQENPEVIGCRHLKDVGLKSVRTQYLGSLDGANCYSAEVEEEASLPETFHSRHLRSVLGIFNDELFSVVSRAFQVMNWDRNHQYCGRCGSKTENRTDERAKQCPKCGLVTYPRISPAVIVAVTRGDKILLAYAGRFKTPLFSVLAGFVEAGETFEECVHREIKEEVNIEVKNIRYFGSQPWPFPDSIMIGFTAEYASGEIKVDGKEILDARWFGRDEIPNIPGKWSIARKLIDSFIAKAPGS